MSFLNCYEEESGIVTIKQNLITDHDRQQKFAAVKVKPYEQMPRVGDTQIKNDAEDFVDNEENHVEEDTEEDEVAENNDIRFKSLRKKDLNSDY